MAALELMILNMKSGFFTTLTFFVAFVLSVKTSWAQKEFNFAGGYSSPEMLNVGLRMRVNQNQFGLSVGTNPGYKQENVSVSGDFYYHFGGSSSHTNLRPWYLKTGLTYMYSEDEWEQRMNLVLVPRLGREFNLTDRFGIALEAGIMIMLMSRDREKQHRPDSFSGDLDLIGRGVLMASAGFKVYYRL